MTERSNRASNLQFFAKSNRSRAVARPQRPAPRHPCATVRSDEPNVFGSRPLRALALHVGDALSFLELLQRYADERGLVKEDVLAGFGRNESESFVGQSLDFAFGHGEAPSEFKRSTA